MNDYIRESISYPGLFAKMFAAEKKISPEKIFFGDDKDLYYLYYEPENITSDKIIYWIHGGGWNSGNPSVFDFVGQCIAGAGYRFVSIGYRLSPKNKYPRQIKDVCKGFSHSVRFLKRRGINTSKIIMTGSSAGAHLASILCFSEEVRRKTGTDISGVIGFIGLGGPYSFTGNKGKTINILLDLLFRKGFDRSKGEPVSLMTKRDIPILLIQSRHDGLIDFENAEHFAEKAVQLGSRCELSDVTDRKNTHSWYTAGIFLLKREQNSTLDKFFSWAEDI